MMAAAPTLRIGGVQPLTTVEWQDRLSAVLFLQGCPWRCRYCHNHALAALDAPNLTPWDAVLDLLRDRRGLLDAVVFSGGEPTLQPGLLGAIETVRELGYDVALHSNGYDPARLGDVLDSGLVGYVAMDLKAPWDKYPLITGVPDCGAKAAESARLVVASGVEHEFRTTYHPALLDEADLREIALTLRDLGAEAYYVQLFRAEGCADEELNTSPLLPARVPENLAVELAGMFERFAVRGQE